MIDFTQRYAAEREKWRDNAELRMEREAIQEEGAGTSTDEILSAPVDAGDEVSSPFIAEDGRIPSPENLTDKGNGQRFARHWKGTVHYCYPWRSWLYFDGTRWTKDSSGEIERRGKGTVEAMFAEAAAIPDDEKRKDARRWALASESATRIRHMIALAQSEPGIPVAVDELDSNAWLFNVVNGTVDLRTGTLREHRPEDLITKLSPIVFDSAATCPSYLEFIDRIFRSRPGLIAYVRRALGYSLTAKTGEHIMFIEFGAGSNGKTTLNRTAEALLGDYAISTPSETLMAKHGDGGIPNDVARLCGARFVTASESEDGKRLAESKVKQLTGGDKVSARFLHAEFFDFAPGFKLWFSTNHRPEIRGTDEAIWRRIHLIPFDVTIPKEKRIPDYFETVLRPELPGILAWAVAGCQEWQKRGLDPPPEVQAATAAYREEQDVLGQFIENRCIKRNDLKTPAGQLYEAFKRWAEGERQTLISATAFGLRLTEKGFEKHKSSGNWWIGIGLVEEARP